MMPRKKTPKQQRYELIRSLCLESVAADVNRKKLTEILRKIESGSERDRRRMKRLVRLHEDGELDELPTDLQANGGRMKRVLFALHLAFPAGKFVVTRSVKRLATAAGIGVETFRRGILDLEAAFLIIVRRNDRSNRNGGQGDSEYRFVLSNLRDLALSQGLQGELFDSGRDDSAASSGVGELPGSRPANCEKAVSHGENPPSHGENPPSHCENPYRPRAGNTLAESSNTLAEGSNTLAEGESSSAKSCEEERKKKDDFYIGNEKPCDVSARYSKQSAVQKLKKFELLTPSKTIEQAIHAGWNLPQIHALCDDVARQALNGVRKYSGGMICWQLENAEPGIPINAKPTEEWQREKAAESTRNERILREKRETDEAERRRRENAAAKERDDRFGHVLNEMNEQDLRTLIDRTDKVLSNNAPPERIKKTFRDLLLRQLETEAELVTHDQEEPNR